MPPITKRINAPAIATTVSNAKSRAGDDAAMLAAKQRARRDAAMKATGSMGKQAGAAVAGEKRKADTFANNVAASKVVAKAENVRKAGVFYSMYAQSKQPVTSPADKAARKPVPGGRPSRAVRGMLARVKR